MSIWGMIVVDKENMGYDSLLGAVVTNMTGSLIKKRAGQVTLIRHRASETAIFSDIFGSSEVYRKLLTVSCPNLPRSWRWGKRRKNSSSEEYVQGDTLGRFYRVDF
ncbi:MAG: hypothetical protein ACLRMZ_20940 [Blautia marasmi]